MELQYIVLTIIKILISVPTMVIFAQHANAAALIGGHADNSKIDSATNNSVPDPEKLVVPGYNLPERIFNRGKPFYLERDPLTGNVDFNSKTEMYEELEEYEDGIDRKDGPINSASHHKSSDINQLTPNFHDFLNLPVKYNPDKYVYPLISSSYANTKVQGNVNKHQNHKNYVVTTYKPTLSPAYFTTKQFHAQNKVIEFTSTTGGSESTTKLSPVITTTTKKPMSLFEQLFGSDYEETAETTESIVTTTHRNVMSGSNMGYEYDDEHPAKVSQVHEEYDYDYATEKTTTAPSSTTVVSSTTTISTTPKITTTTMIHSTSLPIGENHIHIPNSAGSTKIIVTSQNLRDQLNNEKVASVGFVLPQAPSTSNIRIAPDQDTVSFVMGNHQNVEGPSGSFAGSAIKESPYESNPFRPVYDDGKISVKPGKVVDEPPAEIEQTDRKKIVFPDDKENPTPPISSTSGDIYSTDLSPPPPINPVQKEVLKLNSKPMFHQLPSELMPPNKENRVRPPWDPRPGHFQTGRPEYVRPPRPQPPQKPELVYKRIDNLPNILPQFRPNMNLPPKHPNIRVHQGYHPPPPPPPPKNYARQPLLERPSNNRPIGFFEKYHEPSKIAPKVAEDRIITNIKDTQEPFGYLQAPPRVVLQTNNRRQDPETLQMIQAKLDKKQSPIFVEKSKNTTGEKPLYVVYPVNTASLKLDALSQDKKESVVIGTRAELPLPPSKIRGTDFKYEVKERHDSPILKPKHPILSSAAPNHQYPQKSDFPYPLERPDLSVLSSPEVIENKITIEEPFSSNQWNTIDDNESRIVVGKHQNNNQISVTLKTSLSTSDRPIAVAYTPTQPTEKYPMPNYANLVVPEIRDSEVTVGAVMRHEQVPSSGTVHHVSYKQGEFQAPFQASAHIDQERHGVVAQGWAVVRDKEAKDDEEASTQSALSSVAQQEFDIENFKPQLEGGFKPIYNFPQEDQEDTSKETKTKTKETEPFEE